MKIRSVLTASAVGSLIAAANIAPASAHDIETIFDVYVRATSEAEPTPESDDADDSEDVAAENQASDADESVSETPEPTAEVEPQNASEPEASDEPEIVVPDDPAAEIDVSPLIAPVELSPAVPSAEDSIQAAGSPTPESAPESVLPLSQASAAEAVLPLIQESATAAGNSLVQEPARGPDDSPIIGAGADANILPAESEPTQSGTEGTRDIPPEPRKIDTVEIAPENSSPKGEEKEIEAAETPAVDEPLPITGSPSAALALGGALLLAVGVALVSVRRRVSS